MVFLYMVPGTENKKPPGQRSLSVILPQPLQVAVRATMAPSPTRLRRNPCMPMFVDTTPAGQCLFCLLVAGEIPSARVYEDDMTLAFMDIGQVNPGHVLVATKRHATTLLDLTPQEAAAVMQTAQRVAKAIEATFQPPGITLLQANGREGDQTVFHFHIHVLPRHAQDGVTFTWPRKEPDTATLQGYAERLAAAIAAPA